MLKVPLKKLRENARTPTRGSSAAAGYDLYACLAEPVVIAPHTTERIGTGITAALPDGYFAACFARSGLASRQGLRPANCVGVVDSDYRGEYIVALYNDSQEPRTVHDGDRIAQLVVMPYLQLDFEQVDSLPETERGDGGFGSTGTR